MNPRLPVRFHHLKEVAKSGAHYLDLVQRQARNEDNDQTPSMEKGSAVHHLLFQTAHVIFYPGAVRRGKEWEAFQEAHADSMILTRSDYDKAKRMAEAVYYHPRAYELLFTKSPIHEKTLLWDYLGRQCRITPDAVPGDYSYVVDLKTSASAEPFRFGVMANRYHYVTALDYYRTGIRELKLGTANDCYLVAVESTAPYPVCVYHATERNLALGHRTWTGWFERLRGYEASGRFPGYSDADIELDAAEEIDLEGWDDDPTEEAA